MANQIINQEHGKKISEQLKDIARLYKEIEKVLDAIKKAKQKATKPEYLNRAKAEISDANQYLKRIFSLFYDSIKKLIKLLSALDDAVNKEFITIDKLLLEEAEKLSPKNLVALGEEIKDITLKIHQAAKLEELGVLSQKIEKPKISSIKLLEHINKLVRLAKPQHQKPKKEFLKIIEKKVLLLKAIDLDILSVFTILDAMLSHLHGRAFLASEKNRELLEKIIAAYKQAKREFADKALSVFQHIRIATAVK
ncbi:hypothetical protein DRJ19_03265 [Candidatus Woesearchaeota archaeon]|nr:MAG: hypothetical protein DRJ19_03265 [Candidatus Woesearchaeota archaeon]